jgi:hypothetical protein
MLAVSALSVHARNFTKELNDAYFPSNASTYAKTLVQITQPYLHKLVAYFIRSFYYQNFVDMT